MADYRQGFETLHEEITADALPVTGNIPTWLRGTLIRNGPGQFELPTKAYNHWFDGLAMLHRFTVADGQVSYANRYLRSHDYENSTRTGKVNMRAFATDPCMTLFNRVMSVFDTNMTDNANINVVNWAGRFVALTESPLAVEFDPVTLETQAHRDFNDHVLHRAATTAHPHTDPTTGTIYNVAVRFDVPRSTYRVYVYDPDADARTLLTEIPVWRPAYIHSFGFSERYIVLAAYPLTVNVPDLAFSGKAFIENYRWRPDDPTRFYLIDRTTGDLAHTFEAEAFFAFHHINAYDDGDEVVVDMAAYADTRAIEGLYLERVRVGSRDVVPSAEPRRYRLNTASGAVTCQRLAPVTVELPRLADSDYARPYRYAYGVSADEATHQGFPNQLVKLDVEANTAQTWRVAGCYPSEPVFVPAPDGTTSDAGVLLSVVLDVSARRSFLLVLDAATMTEIARAEAPHGIPFGFHGQFYEGVGTA